MPAGPVLGATRAAADTVTAKAPGRAISYTTYMTTDASSVAVTELARARVEIDTAWLLAFEVAAYVDACGAGAPGPGERGPDARTARPPHRAAPIRRRPLLNVAGAGSFAQSNPVQRIWQDVNVASRHAFLATNPSMETYGRSLLGLDPILFII